MKNVHYNGGIGAYVATIGGKEYKLLALNMKDALAEAAAMRKFLEATI